MGVPPMRRGGILPPRRVTRLGARRPWDTWARCPCHTIKGTRIAVEFVIELLGRGWALEQILHEYDHLSREDIQACLAWASEVLHGEKVSIRP